MSTLLLNKFLLLLGLTCYQFLSLSLSLSPSLSLSLHSLSFALFSLYDFLLYLLSIYLFFFVFSLPLRLLISPLPPISILSDDFPSYFVLSLSLSRLLARLLALFICRSFLVVWFSSFLFSTYLSSFSPFPLSSLPALSGSLWKIPLTCLPTHLKQADNQIYQQLSQHNTDHLKTTTITREFC